MRAAYVVLPHDSQPTWYSRSRLNIQASRLIVQTILVFHKNEVSTLIVYAAAIASQAQIDCNKVGNSELPKCATGC